MSILYRFPVNGKEGAMKRAACPFPWVLHRFSPDYGILQNPPHPRDRFPALCLVKKNKKRVDLNFGLSLGIFSDTFILMSSVL